MNTWNPYELIQRGFYEQAAEVWEKSYEKNPFDLAVVSNLGVVFTYLLRLDEAIFIYRKALSAFPDHPVSNTIRWNLATPLLMQGHLKEGFACYEYRTKVKQLTDKYLMLSTPRWQGEDLQGKVLLVRSVEGLGDAVQFLRYLPCLSSHGCKILIALQKPLYSLFGHLPFPLISLDQEIPSHDFHIDVMSFPYLFGTDLASIPPPTFLPQKAFYLPKKHRIAIVWKGNPNTARDRHRSMHVKWLAPLLACKHISFVSLQKDATEEERAFLASYRVEIPPLCSLEETCQILLSCEKVISVDTMVAHLAGSLGIATWLLISYVPEWRWLLDRNDSPWYPSVSLFRQKRVDDWSYPIEQIFNLLSKAP